EFDPVDGLNMCSYTLLASFALDLLDGLCEIVVVCDGAQCLVRVQDLLERCFEILLQFLNARVDNAQDVLRRFFHGDMLENLRARPVDRVQCLILQLQKDSAPRLRLLGEQFSDDHGIECSRKLTSSASSDEV